VADSGEGHPASPSAAVDRLAAFREELRLVSRDPAKNRDRFYTLRWQPSLFGEPALVRTWGRVGTVGRSRASVYPDATRAQAAIVALLRRRLRHGYRVVAWR
jgi:predicted DNA-binding WGR domain protein